jgi:hypothetical protein
VQLILDRDAETYKNMKFVFKLGEDDFDEILLSNILSDCVKYRKKKGVSTSSFHFGVDFVHDLNDIVTLGGAPHVNIMLIKL